MVKNLLLFLAFFFTLGDHDTNGATQELWLLGRITLAFVFFSMVSGSGYIINDYRDLDNDRRHPQKKHRALASGRVKPAVALVFALILMMVGIGGGFVLQVNFGLVSLIYLIGTVGYSLYFKDRVILDVFSVATGFVLRAAAGAVVIDLPVSPWLYVMTSLGALLISLGKRRSEIEHLGEESVKHRPVLKEYSVEFTNQLISVVAPATVLAYMLYTFTSDRLPENNLMMLTIPFVLFGVFRYMFHVYRGDLAGSPEEIFLRDRLMLVNIVLWLIVSSTVLLLTT